jgi:hypothetical protein
MIKIVGYVTYNQFRRGIPQNLLSLEEEDILLVRYGEPVTGTVNYFKMNTDVNRKAPKPKVDAAQLVAKLKLDADYENEHVPVGTEELLHANLNSYGAGKPDLPAVEDKIKKCNSFVLKLFEPLDVYKNRIRLLEFFRDYDRHNFGLVSEAQVRMQYLTKKLNIPQKLVYCFSSTFISSFGGSRGFNLGKSLHKGWSCSIS